MEGAFSMRITQLYISLLVTITSSIALATPTEWEFPRDSRVHICENPKGWQPTREQIHNFVNKMNPESFCDADLRGADLSEADLREVRLLGANLSKAKLGGADLRGAYLEEVNLQNADLT